MRLISIIILMLSISNVFAREDCGNIRKGNNAYKNDRFEEAEIEYRKGLHVNQESFESAFNLGNALYKQEKYDAAVASYEKASALTKNKNDKSNALYNIGNAFFQQKDYQKSIEAFKQSLKLNPKDDEARYNLALAKRMLQQQQNQENQNNKNNSENNQQQQQKQQQNDDKNQNKQNEPQKNEMTDENANQILDAFLQDEKDVQERVRENQQRQSRQRRAEKDW